MEVHWRNPLVLNETDRDAAEQRISRLAEHHRDLIDVWVDVTEDHHHRQGSANVTLRGQVRRAEIVARGDDVKVRLALHHALDAFERQLRDLRERRVENFPSLGHPPSLRGFVDRLISSSDYGFLVDESGEHVYFHRNALRGLEFDQLREGDCVAFDVEAGDKGPQAVVVTPAPITPVPSQ